MRRQTLSLLYFTNSLIRGGAEEHIITLVQGLDRSLFRIHMVCPPEVAEKLQPDLPEDVELLPLSFSRLSHVASGLNLAQFIGERQVDILHSHLFYSSLFASPVGRLCRVPVIIETPHVREHWRRGWKSHFVVDRLAGRFVDYYIAVSEANARYLVGEKALPREKVVVIQNGCDLMRFHPERPAPPGMKKSLGFGEHDPVLMVIGRLEAQKGHWVLLEALPIIRREFPTARLVCVGEGSLRGALEEEASSLSLNGAVRFVGYQANVAEWLSLPDVTVLPSFYEGLPLVAVESLAAGRPVVATAVDGTPEVIIDGKTGLVVPPGNPERLARAICRLLRNPGLRLSLARSGRKWVEERFSRERQIQKTQELYLNAWEKRGRRVGLHPSESSYRVQRYWNEVAARIEMRGPGNFIAGDDTPFTRYVRSRFLKEFQKIDFRGQAVLEVGCGPGGNLQVVGQANPANLIGCDISKRMLGLAKVNFSRSMLSPAKLVQVDGDTLPFQNKSVDISFTVTALQHNTDEEMFANVLREICRVTRKKVLLFEDTFFKRWPKFSNTARPVSEYEAHMEKWGFRSTEVKYLSTAFSNVVCSTIRRLTSPPQRKEGEALPEITTKLQLACVPVTRHFDRLFPVKVGLTKMVFCRED